MKTIRIHLRNSLTLLAVLCAVVLGAAIFSACSGPWNSENGTIRINLGGGARSIPVTDEMKAVMIYDISLTRGTESEQRTLGPGSTTVNIAVTPGVWNIAVSAYLSDEDLAEGNVFGKNEDGQSVTVRAGKTSDAKIIMKPEEKILGDVIVITLDPSGKPEVKYADGTSIDEKEIKISRSGADSNPAASYEIKLDNPDNEFTDITWEVPGVGAGADVTGNGDSFTLRADDSNYNSLGGHVLYLEFEWKGRPYLVEIPFEVVE